jgi:hypothetical protein
LAQHKWSDSQLAELGEALAKEDFLADYQFAMRGERACGNEAMARFRVGRFSTGSGDAQDLPRLADAGWLLLPESNRRRSLVPTVQSAGCGRRSRAACMSRGAPPTPLQRRAGRAHSIHYLCPAAFPGFPEGGAAFCPDPNQR